MSWTAKSTVFAMLLSYALASSTPVFAADTLASINPKRDSIECVLNSVSKKNITAKDIASILKGHDDDIESMLIVINKLLNNDNTIYSIEGAEVRKSFFHSLNDGPPYSKDSNGCTRYKTMAPVDNIVYASAEIIDGDVHVYLKLKEKVEIQKWFIKAISIPSSLDFVIKPIKTDYGYKAEFLYASKKPFVSKLASFFKGIHADYIDARNDGKGNNRYMLEMINSLHDKGLIRIYEK